MHTRMGAVRAALRRAVLATVAAGLTVLPLAPAAAALPDGDAAKAVGSEAERLFGAIVKVQTRAVPDARSSATLGAEREGTGVVIDEHGLVLTIGYLVVEADEVRITDSRGGVHSAKVVGYDHPTGLGLVRIAGRLDVVPVALGDSASLKEREPVMIVNHEGRGDVTFAFVVSRRQFTGNWEYLIDEAIFTAPPTLKWSGAALIGNDGHLLGIGSLIVRDALPGAAALPGNMFVPIDLLKPVLADLLKTGRRAGPARPWLGVNADEVQGRLVVARVSPESPAQKAGIEPGDIILAVGRDGVRTQADFYRKLWAYGAAGTDIPLRVLHDIDVREVQIRSIDRAEHFVPRPIH